jgi:phosphoribosylaminoimidazole (AIR) synthetase
MIGFSSWWLATDDNTNKHASGAIGFPGTTSGGQQSNGPTPVRRCVTNTISILQEDVSYVDKSMKIVSHYITVTALYVFSCNKAVFLNSVLALNVWLQFL